jgi:hypothetical protein
MKKRPYKRKPGDSEIRILKNGQVVMITPDETLMEVARTVEPNNSALSLNMETKENGRIKTSKTRSNHNQRKR